MVINLVQLLVAPAQDKICWRILGLMFDAKLKQVAMQQSAMQLYLLAVAPGFAAELLEFLFQADLVTVAICGVPLPVAANHGWHYPFVQVDDAKTHMAIRLPVSHVKSVRDDSGARAQLFQQAWPELQIDHVKQIQRNHGGIA